MALTPQRYFELVPDTVDMTIRSELYHTNEFNFAVAVILSAQATDKKVNEVTPELFRVAGSADKMLALGIEGLKNHIKVISFFNNKAKNIIALAQKLVDENITDIFPERYHNRDALMKLPGIGQKTANVICNVLWHAPNIGVDTHVFRNAHRYGWVDDADNTPEKVERKLLEKIPRKYHPIVNHVMVLHGRYVCKALRPECEKCVVAKWCKAPDKKI